MDIFNLLQLGLIVKLFFLVVILFYFIFAAVCYRQISLMTQVLDSKISPLIRLIAIIQIITIGIMFFIALIFA